MHIFVHTYINKKFLFLSRNNSMNTVCNIKYTFYKSFLFNAILPFRIRAVTFINKYNRITKFMRIVFAFIIRCITTRQNFSQEKAAWVSDISQCMDNVHFNDLLHGSLSDTSSVTMPQSIRNDPKLFKDDVDIRFSRTLNSCKIPQIRSATPERLLQRLTDLRFLSIDFLNTFLLTYRVFTDGVTVLEALKKVFYEAEPPDAQIPTGSLV